MPFAVPSNNTNTVANTVVERLLDDPIMDLLMACDGVTRADVLNVIEDVRHSLRTRQLDKAA